MIEDERQAHEPGPVTRCDVVTKLKRLNDLERILPIYRQALEVIQDSDGTGPAGVKATRALKEALRDDY